MRFFLRAFLIFIILLIISFFAAPFFVRQEQVKNFVENRIKLPEDAKLKLDGNIDFGIFPYAYIKVPKATITDSSGHNTVFENFSFGFNPSSLMGKSISFDAAFKFNGIDYDGNLHIKDYGNFYNNLKSPIVLNLKKPIEARALGNFNHEENSYSLDNFKITNESINATGNLKITQQAEKSQKVILNTDLNADNINDFIKLANFNKQNENSKKLSGAGSVKLNISTLGSNSDQLKANLNGQGSINVTNGEIYGIDMNEILALNSAVILGTDISKKIDITNANANFNISNGIVNISDFSAKNQLADASGNGVADITKNYLNMYVDIDAHTNVLQAKVPLLVSGNFNNIKFTPRVADAIAGNIDKIDLKNAKLKLDKDNLKGSLKEIGKNFGLDLGSIIGGNKSKQPADIAPAAEPNQQPTQ